MTVVTRAFVILAALCVAPAFVFPNAFAADSAELERLAGGIFRIEAGDAHGRTLLGSGVLVAPQTLVTNCHVVGDASVIVITGAATRLPARLVRAHVERDLCLLNVPGIDGVVVTLGNTATQAPGDAITAVGFPRGSPVIASAGRIEGLFRYDGAGRVVQGSAAFGGGKSGGALYDSAGKLIGILTFKARAGGPFHFAVPVEWVVALMHDAAPRAAAGGKPFWQLPRERQPVFLRAVSLAGTTRQ